MKMTFESKSNAIEWLAEKLGNKRQFEALRDQLNNGFNYNGTYLLKVKKLNLEFEIGEEESAYLEAV